MSVVGPDFEKLKRFNIEELRQPLSSFKPETDDQSGTDVLRGVAVSWLERPAQHCPQTE